MKCGTGLTLACSKCNTKLPTGAAFCFACGQPVAPAPGRQRFIAPDAYTPGYLAEKILTSKSALEGERRQVTVVFVDLKGSMELLVDRDPEEARKILDPVLELMMEAVHRYEGTVNQVMGDGIMALFGAPLSHARWLSMRFTGVAQLSLCHLLRWGGCSRVSPGTLGLV